MDYINLKDYDLLALLYQTQIRNLKETLKDFPSNKLNKLKQNIDYIENDLNKMQIFLNICRAKNIQSDGVIQDIMNDMVLKLKEQFTKTTNSLI